MVPGSLPVVNGVFCVFSNVSRVWCRVCGALCVRCVRCACRALEAQAGVPGDLGAVAIPADGLQSAPGAADRGPPQARGWPGGLRLVAAGGGGPLPHLRATRTARRRAQGHPLVLARHHNAIQQHVITTLLLRYPVPWCS